MMNRITHDIKQPAMRDAILHLLFLTLLFSLAFVSSPGWAQIVEHFELVRDNKSVSWTDLEGRALGQRRGTSDAVAVTPGERAQGRYNGKQGTVYSEAYGQTPTLDLQTLMPENGKERGSRALWQNRLPIGGDWLRDDSRRCGPRTSRGVRADC